ncbi:SRPBCC family protein [Mycobacterium vicinigordonae]|uniref:SRPBCC family protein n=1 Tax=Mycobacterium vicinigordonae TaxID=1719132 RepID=A0A7D6HTP4_9MYCO|nr:SRPBCC family protein [Mycobacterium vicinigordonae]QLL06433.1 SRPBCC family protein [Mycobacterium vicinigordonae]
MPQVTASVVIPHPAQVVWDYIIDPDHLSIILPGIVSVDAGKEPPYGPGDVWHGVSRSFGITNKWTGVFTRVDIPHVMEMEITESRFPFATIDTLEEVASGTRYTFRVTGDPALGGPLGRLVDAVMSMAFKRTLVKHLARLPAHIDAWVSEKR